MVMKQCWLPLLCVLLSKYVKSNYLDVFERGLSQTTQKKSHKLFDAVHGVKMGVPNDFCDNGKDNLDNDWNPLARGASKVYQCQGRIIENVDDNTQWFCEKKHKEPYHECMNVKIVYKERIPLSGRHRPLWPVYGEYTYLPPQRWVHSMEHGAAVFLYHPCADPREVELLRQLARACLRRHILTPYNRLRREQPFAIVTWGCKLTISKMTDEAIGAAIDFIKKTAIRKSLPEWRVSKDGQYNEALIHKADVVTDEKDSKICPLY